MRGRCGTYPRSNPPTTSSSGYGTRMRLAANTSAGTIANKEFLVRLGFPADAVFDVVVNNAGYDLDGAIEEISIDEMRAMFETNFFGAVKVMKAVIPMMRNRMNGKIVNITSMGGRIAIPFHSIYHGTKFALEGLSESIQYELEPFGIKIILIEPGGSEL